MLDSRAEGLWEDDMTKEVGRLGRGKARYRA